MLASDPRYNALALLQAALCVAINPHMHPVEVRGDDPLMMAVYADHLRGELGTVLADVADMTFGGIG